MDPNATLPENYTTDAPVSNYVELFIWEKGQQRQLYIELPHASFFTYEFKRLEGIGERTKVDNNLKKELSDQLALAKFDVVGDRLSPKAAEPDKIYVSDFESTINHMIFNEICSVEVITGKRLQAARGIINVIDKYFTGRSNVVKVVTKVQDLLGENGKNKDNSVK